LLVFTISVSQEAALDKKVKHRLILLNLAAVTYSVATLYNYLFPAPVSDAAKIVIAVAYAVPTFFYMLCFIPFKKKTPYQVLP
ncbi:hypothetical protein KIPB_010316, partial [Kipferlia bialata]